MSRAHSGRRGLPLGVQFILSICFGLFVAGGFYAAYMFYLTVKELSAHTRLPTIPVLYLPVPGQQKPVPVIVREETVDWEKKERVNVLMLGIDRRPGETGPWRTDTMILGTIDPNSETAGMLSIPRDLWVSIPGFEENRVNMANFLGESKQYPGGGPALAKKTVEYNLGVPVNYYVRVDFGGFEKLVDTIGGLDIDVEKDIIDDTYPDEAYGYDPLYIPAGRQHMDGKLALKFARTRHGASDFERAKRQQQVLLAIRDKALQLNLLPKLPELMVILADTIETDLQPSDILTLAQAASKVGRDKVKSSFVDESMTLRHVTPTGADVLLPVREKIRPMIDSIFTSSVAMVPVKVTVQVQEVNQLAQDGAKISVMNGTQNMDLAEQTIAYLKKQGYQLAETSQADRTDYPKTIIIDYTGKIYTLGQLTAALNVPSDEIRHSPNLQSGVDIRVILGADLKLPEEE